MTNVKIRYIEKDEPRLIELWNQLVIDNNLPPQACYAWKWNLETVFKANVFALLAFDDNDKTTGLTLVFYRNGESILYSCRYGFYAKTAETAEALKREIMTLAARYNLQKTVITSGSLEFDLVGKQTSKESLYLPLAYPNEDELWLSVPQKTKNMVRKAGKSGIEISYDWAHLAQFYDIYTDRFTEKSLSIKPYAHFESIRDLFGDDAVFLGAIQNGVLKAGMIFVTAGSIVSYAYNASNLDASNNGANNLLMWKAMEFFHTKGAKYIDLSESTPASPVYKFKKRFNKDIEARSIFYYDFSEGLENTENRRSPLSLFIKNKMRGVLHRLMPIMPRFLKMKYLQYLGMGGRLI